MADKVDDLQPLLDSAFDSDDAADGLVDLASAMWERLTVAQRQEVYQQMDMDWDDWEHD